MDKVDNLILFNNALMNYMTSLRDPDSSLDSIRKDNNTNILKILFSALILILNKEDIKTADEDAECYINEHALEKIISKICNKNTNKYYIGNIELETKEEVIKTIRDKIAHGAFLVDPSTCDIIIDFNGTNAKIPGKDFVDFVSSLFLRFNYNTNETIYNKNQLMINVHSSNRINNRQNINPFLKNIEIVSYSFEREDGYITPEDKEIIEDLLNSFKPIFKNDNSAVNTTHLMTLLNSELAKRGIKAKCKIEKMKNSIYGQSLRKFIKRNIKQMSYLSVEDQYDLVTNWYRKIRNNDNVLKTGMFYNIYLLRIIEKGNANSLREILEQSSGLSLWSSIMEMYLSSALLSFYVHYQYPLENIMKIKDNLQDEEEYFDYSLLDLSFLVPDIFKIPEKREEERATQLRSVEKNLEDVEKILKSYRNQMFNISLIIHKTDDPNKIFMYRKKISKVYKSYIQTQKNRQELEIKRRERKAAVEEYNIEKPNSYYRNRYLIEYIRNAISHGNVFFDYNETEGDIHKASIRFINDYEGTIYLDLNSSIMDFNKLFNYDNLSIISQFVAKKQQKKKQTKITK